MAVCLDGNGASRIGATVDSSSRSRNNGARIIFNARASRGRDDISPPGLPLEARMIYLRTVVRPSSLF